MRMVSWENFSIAAVGFGETLGGHGVAVLSFNASPQPDLDRGQLVFIDLPFDERHVAQKIVEMFGKKKSPTLMTGIRLLLDEAGLIDRLGEVNPSYANRFKK